MIRCFEKEELPELREKFVKGRFEEIFKNEDIEEWLSAQRKSNKPEHEICSGDVESLWLQIIVNRVDEDHFFFDVSNDSASDLLDSIGFSVSFSLNVYSAQRLLRVIKYDKDEVDWAIEAFSKAFNSHCVYATRRSLIFFDSDSPVVFFPSRDGGTYKKNIIPSEIAESAFLNWFLLGADTYSAGRSRAHLCDWLERCIKKVRKEAESDFDEAVAVSEDGKKVVKADIVIESSDNGNVRTVFKKGSFTNRKIVRNKFIWRDNNIFSEYSGELPDKFVEDLCNNMLVDRKQIFCKIISADNIRSIFVVRS